jgi:signal transduction histidine kinase/FixJ family two-component response regulator
MDNAPHPNGRIQVKVIKHIAPGLLVELPAGQNGIVRVREISWSENKHLDWRKLRPLGWTGWAVPLQQRESRFPEFSLRLAENDPWDELSEPFDKDEVYAGTVTGLVGYGAFIEIVPGLTGLLHQSTFPHWIKTPPLDLLWPGDKVHVRLQAIDRPKRHLSLVLPPVSPPPGAGLLPQRPVKGPGTNGESITTLDEFLKTRPPKNHILLVEDETEQALAVSNWLRRVGQRVDVTPDAEKALDFLQKSQTDIALIDVGLPKMDGLELAGIVLERWPQVRVISTTDWARADDIMDTLDALQERGAELLLKPILPEDLIGVLKKLGAEPKPVPAERIEARPLVKLTEIPGIKANRSLHELLRQCRKHLGFEQAILFALDALQRTISIIERSGGGAMLDQNALPALIFSPVRDVAEDRETVTENEIQPHDRDRFRYLLELCPTTTSCIGVPVPAQAQMDYALFVLDKHARQINPEQKLYAEAIALALGTALEQENFKEKSTLLQRTALTGHLTRALVHEINNLVGPLASRLDNLQLNLTRLEKNPHQPDLQEVRNRLIGNELAGIQKNIHKIINTTRMFGRIVVKNKNEILRVDEIIQDTIELLRDTSHRSHVTMVFNPPGQLLVIRSQTAALEQVLLNVMLNAIQQIAELRPDSGGWVQVRIESHCESSTSGFFRVLIEDNGPGIHTSLFEKVFEAGYTTRHDGSGIGLYISRNLVEEIGGKIYVQESCVLGGTTFALEIPCQI